MLLGPRKTKGASPPPINLIRPLEIVLLSDWVGNHKKSTGLGFKKGLSGLTEGVWALMSRTHRIKDETHGPFANHHCTRPAFENYS